MTTVQAEEASRERQVARVLSESETPADVVAEQPLESDPHPDRIRRFTHTSLARMRFTWGPEEQIAMEEVHASAAQVISRLFVTAYHVQERVYKHVRLPMANTDTGEVLTFPDGSPRWQLDEYGDPVEDYLRLSDRDRELLLFAVTTHLFEWEQQASRLWTDAMFAKGIWEETFAGAYIGSSGKTVDDRTQAGHKTSMEARYFALFQSSLSRRADAVVRSMTRMQALLARDYKR